MNALTNAATARLLIAELALKEFGHADTTATATFDGDLVIVSKGDIAIEMPIAEFRFELSGQQGQILAEAGWAV